MVVVGADVHKRTHTFVAVDEAGRKLAEKTVRAVTAGHAEAVMWAREHFGAEVIWAIEDICRHAWSVTCWPWGRRWCGYRRS